MKKLLLFVCMVAGIQGFAFPTVIKGNGISKSEERNAADYTSLAAGGPISIDIVYGSSNSITVQGDENILPYIETFVKDGKLTIRVKDLVTIKPSMETKVKVSMKTINTITQSGSGSITGNGDFMNEGKANIGISGSGNIRLSFAKFNEAEIKMSGSGSLELTGNIMQSLDVSQSGSGRINCLNAPSANVFARVSGSGNMKVNATKMISAHVSGSGKIYYTGNADAVDTKVSGSGGIEKI